jgi:DNA-binding CsgD family transcriptional regulator
MQDTIELTEREREILSLLAKGTSNKDIAHQLFISSNTVKVHIRNIFAKIGVNSRTEAAVYAIREGLSHTFQPPDALVTIQDLTAPAPLSLETKRKPYYLWVAALMTIVLVGVVTFVLAKYQAPAIAIPSSEPAVLQRWQQHADMPTARSGLAIASQETKIYAIGGDTKVGVTNVVERYDLVTDTWVKLSTKPTAVADVNAAIVGGRIYIPGGRLASGQVTDILEIYDPRLDSWEQGATLPISISAYALTTFEGKFYLFGGWDGEHFLASVYEYDPDQDAWSAHSPMLTARGFAGVAEVGGKIYVFGGYDGKEALTENDEYLPDRDIWSQRAPLPAGRYAMGAASIADIIYAVGGVGEMGSPLPPLQYLHQQDQWQTFEDPFLQQWSYLGLVSLPTQLYGIGGKSNGIPVAQNQSYQAIYTILIPQLSNKP